MTRLKRLAALVLSGTLCLGLLAGCGKTQEALVLPVCAGSDLATFDPAFITSSVENTVVGSLYENLMRLSADVSGDTVLAEGLAKSVDVDENFDGTVTYTFHLRSAHWSDGRNVKADDFVYAWQRLVNPLTYSPSAPLLSVVQGYDAVRAGGDPSELAVTAKNDTTLEVVLTGKYEWFLSGVCTAPATVPLRQDVIQRLKENADKAVEAGGLDAGSLKWWYDPTALVTNGAYQASDYQPGQSLDLIRSERYYGRVANDGLHFVFAEDGDGAWSLYDEKTVDFVYELPQAQITELQTADETWLATPELSTYTLLFNANQQPFDDPAVRMALLLAIDRHALAELAGSTARAAEGLIPFGVPGSGEKDFRTEGGDLLNVQPEDYEENCIAARRLIADSGYDEHYDLEYLYVDEGPAAQIAQAVAAHWKSVVGVIVRPRAVSETELIVALRTGEYGIAASSRKAQLNDAEAFLAPFTGRSSQNVVNYANSAYDTLLSIIDSASDSAARLACLHDAEALLLGDAVVCPLYTTGTAWKLREGYSGLVRDARGWFGFANVGAVS